jgi:hypothetical protein
MQAQKSYLAIVILGFIGLAGSGLLFFFSEGKNELQLVPNERVIREQSVISSTEAGTGWSSKEDPAEAVKEAVEMALANKKNRSPDFAVIFASSGSDMDSILLHAKRLFHGQTKIYGGSSDSRAVMTNRGYAKATDRAYEYARLEQKRSLAVMTISSENILFGVGSVDCLDHISPQSAAKEAALGAAKNAGKSPDEKPQAILLTAPRGMEEEVLEGIEEIFGKETPILGGTAGGPTFASFGEAKAYERGISLAAIYTSLTVGWWFEGGFEVESSHSGVVTKVDGQAICEIDNRPALDVYDEWLRGAIRELVKEKKKFDLVRALLTLHPLYRKCTSPAGKVYFLFSHPWPKDPSLKEKFICTATKIKVGERIYLSHGTWEALMNRVGNLPKNARDNSRVQPEARPLFGVSYICSGVVGTIPEKEREKLPLLINQANNEAPFIGTFTWGEQGHFTGIGNKHGNLLTSFLVIYSD